MTFKIEADGQTEAKFLALAEVVVGAIANKAIGGNTPTGLPSAAEARLNNKITQLTQAVDMLAQAQGVLPPANGSQQIRALAPSDPKLQPGYLQQTNRAITTPAQTVPPSNAASDVIDLPDPHPGLSTGATVQVSAKPAPRSTRSGIVRTALESRGVTSPRPGATQAIDLPPDADHTNILKGTALWLLKAPIVLPWRFGRFMVLVPRKNRIPHVIIRLSLVSIGLTGYVLLARTSDRIPQIPVPNVVKTLVDSVNETDSTGDDSADGDDNTVTTSDPAELNLPDGVTVETVPVAPPGNSGSKAGTGGPVPANAANAD